MKPQSVIVRVPASTANLGPGFDTLGMALNLYLWIELSIANQATVQLSGPHLQGIPEDRSNLIYKVTEHIFIKAGLKVPQFSIKIFSEIPLTRGLGSSASAIVGGMYAANLICGEPFTRHELFEQAALWEEHPDNVSASMFGGFTVSTMPTAEAGSSSISFRPSDDFGVIAVVPDFELPTKAAREVLPASVSLEDAVHNISKSSLLVAAMSTGRMDLIKMTMHDRLHQAYRAKLVPGMEEVLQKACDHGALGAALSGAGPTICCFVNRQLDSTNLCNFLSNTLRVAGHQVMLMHLLPDHAGVCQVEDANVPLAWER